MRSILHWRKMTWALLLWTVIFVIWSIAASDNSSAVRDCVNNSSGYLNQHDCQTAADVGTGIGLTLIWGLWFVGFVILSIIWFMTRRKTRLCPVCGEDVKKGRTTCARCGFDFAAAAAHAAAAVVPETKTGDAATYPGGTTGIAGGQIGTSTNPPTPGAGERPPFWPPPPGWQPSNT
jgi:hypothetical protein